MPRSIEEIVCSVFVGQTSQHASNDESLIATERPAAKANPRPAPPDVVLELFEAMW